MPKFKFISKDYPTLAGCYLMKNASGKIIYVGKAKNLRRRLASYFRKSVRGKIKRLAREIRSIELMIVRNETESLVLEDNLIKHHRPKYNRRQKHPSSGYSYIALTDEPLPRLIPYRKKWRNQPSPMQVPIKRTFGPYVSQRYRDALMDFANDMYLLRTCDPLEDEICLRFHFHKCSAVCEARISEAHYRRDVKKAVRFLASRHTVILRQMQKQMMQFAQNLEFERAQWLKERLELIEAALVQQVVEREKSINQVIIYAHEADALVADVRRGALLSMVHLPLATTELIQYFAKRTPDTILTNLPSDDLEAVLPNHGIHITAPTDDTDHALLHICQMNLSYRTTGEVTPHA